ncbi:hypothetical protein R3P38DRAFT_3132855 [Favolaschia claudopus]|uniref:Uncharacterized protein n=1 Tax=Favolaschia claudopus TaxID=2862362 RepID=A0AAV9Z931_9AGAR
MAGIVDIENNSNGYIQDMRLYTSTRGEGKAGNSSNCCTGSFSSQASCPTSGVDHYNYFKKSCPNCFAYAFDEPSGNTVFQCSKDMENGTLVEYTLTFCPDPSAL